MPLDTDCFIARSLCARAAELAESEGVSLLVAPTLNVTLSWYHMQFPGSIRLSTTTFFSGLPRGLRLARPPRLRAPRRGQRPRRQRRGAHGRRQPLLRDDRAPGLPRAVVGPRRRRARRGRGAADPRRGGGDVARDRARAAGRAGPGDARRLGPRRGRARRRAAVDVARPVRDAPEGPRGDRADGHAPRHHRLGRRRRRDACEPRAGRAHGRGGRAPNRPGLQGHRPERSSSRRWHDA